MSDKCLRPLCLSEGKAEIAETVIVDGIESQLVLIDVCADCATEARRQGFDTMPLQAHDEESARG